MPFVVPPRTVIAASPASLCMLASENYLWEFEHRTMLVPDVVLRGLRVQPLAPGAAEALAWIHGYSGVAIVKTSGSDGFKAALDVAENRGEVVQLLLGEHDVEQCRVALCGRDPGQIQWTSDRVLLDQRAYEDRCFEQMVHANQ